MEQRKLGGLVCSSIGFGCMGLSQAYGRHGVTTGQLALAWLLARGPDVVPIPGTRDAARVAENAAAATVTLSPADLEALEAAAPRTAWRGDRRSFAAHGTTRAR